MADNEFNHKFYKEFQPTQNQIPRSKQKSTTPKEERKQKICNHSQTNRTTASSNKSKQSKPQISIQNWSKVINFVVLMYFFLV